jgi:hypothetical protein
VNTDDDNSDTNANGAGEDTAASDSEPTGIPEPETTGVLDPETTGVTTETTTSDDKDSDEDEGDKETPEEDAYHPETMTTSVQRTYGIRPRKPMDYRHMHTYLAHYAITQYSLKSGLNNFQKKGEHAVSKEFLQLHMRDTFQPRDTAKLSTVPK